MSAVTDDGSGDAMVDDGECVGHLAPDTQGSEHRTILLEPRQATGA
jgi:hypothetical protein